MGTDVPGCRPNAVGGGCRGGAQKRPRDGEGGKQAAAKPEPERKSLASPAGSGAAAGAAEGGESGGEGEAGAAKRQRPDDSD